MRSETASPNDAGGSRYRPSGEGTAWGSGRAGSGVQYSRTILRIHSVILGMSASSGGRGNQ